MRVKGAENNARYSALVGSGSFRILQNFAIRGSDFLFTYQ